jgi:ferric enterobactin receptor
MARNADIEQLKQGQSGSPPAGSDPAAAAGQAAPDTPTDQPATVSVGQKTAAEEKDAAQAEAPGAVADPDAASDIVVTARRPGTEVKIDRIVYDIQTGDDGASLNTTDVLRKLPGVVVTASNGVSIRGGANVGFLIDGKPARRSIALAIPASQIERVELVTNPSAEFDADSEALINLVLKKKAKRGWTGAASGKLDTLGGYRAGVDVAHGGDVWTFNGTLSARTLPGRTKTTRATSYAGPVDGYTSQLTQVDERSTFRQLSAQGRLEGKLSETDSVSLTAGTNYNRNPQNSAVTDRFFGADDPAEDRYARRIAFDGFYPYASASYESLVKNDRRITASLNAYAGQSREERQFSGALNALLNDRLGFSFLEGKLELEKTLAAKTMVDAGLVVSRNRVVDQLLLNGFSGIDQSQQGDFRFTRLSYAAYATLQSTIAGIDIKPGLRLERLDQDLNDAFAAIPGFRQATRLLPSLHLSKKIGAKNTLNASYSARLEKPDATSLNPFLRYSAQFQAERGNPFLRPTTKNQFEISHTRESPKLFLTQTLFYRSTRDDVNSYIFLADNGAAVTSYVNLGSSTSYGYSLTTKHMIQRGLTVSLGADLYHRKIVAPLSLDAYGSIAYTGFDANLNAEYSPTKVDSLTLTASYASKTFTLGQSLQPEISSDLQYSHTFGNKMTITVNLIDIGVPQRLSTRFRSPNLSGTESVFRASRLLRIGLAKPF